MYYTSSDLNRQQYSNYEHTGQGYQNNNDQHKQKSRSSIGNSNRNVTNTTTGFEMNNGMSRPWTPTFTSQDYHSEMQKQHQQRMNNLENGLNFI